MTTTTTCAATTVQNAEDRTVLRTCTEATHPAKTAHKVVDASGVVVYRWWSSK